MMDSPAGYREIEHTADWELHIWAPDLPALFEQAAHGMYVLLKTSLQPGLRQVRQIELSAADPEHLLVSFLSELLWIGEKEGLAFDRFSLEVQENSLIARMEGAPIGEQSKEIKAVTYHNLAIRCRDRRLEVNIVFDV